MSENHQATNLEELLDEIEEAADENKNDEVVTLDNILDVVGRRSFGPLLLVAGIITVAPVIGDIPGVPAIMGAIVFLIAIQLMFRAEHFWFPDWVLNRSVDPEKLNKAVGWLRKPAKFVDRFLKHRLTYFTKGAAVYVIAVTCLLIALALPVMEIVPFSANIAGAALTAFGLSMIAHDGLLAIIAFIFTIATALVVGFNLF